MEYRTLAPGQRAQIWIGGPGIGQPELLFETDTMLIEAPNWSLDDAALYVNADGLLWRLDLSSPEHGLVGIAFAGLPELNNDHVLDPDGEHIYLSAMDGHIYRGALSGGAVDQVSPAGRPLALPAWGVPGRITPGLRPNRRLRRSGKARSDRTAWVTDRGGHRTRPSRRARVVTRRQLDLLQHRRLHRRARPRSARPDSGHRRIGAAPRRRATPSTGSRTCRPTHSRRRTSPSPRERSGTQLTSP